MERRISKRIKSRNEKIKKYTRLSVGEKNLYPDINTDNTFNLYPHEALVNGKEESEMEEDVELVELESPIYNVHSQPLTQNELANRVEQAKLNHRGNKGGMQAPSKETRKSNAKVRVPSNPLPSESSGFSCLKSLKLWFFLLLVLLVSSIPFYIINSLISSPKLESLSSELDVNYIISQLKDSFAGQDPFSFRIIEIALKKVTVGEPDAPAIIILLTAKGAENVSSGFAQHLVKAISPNYLNISGIHYSTMSSVGGKKDIDDKIQDAVNDNELQAVLVNDLDLIPGETALMFYTFCDHENAPYKRVVYVMTVTSQEEFSKEYSGNEWDKTVENRLQSVWSDVSEDKIRPLLARLTVSVAAVTAK